MKILLQKLKDKKFLKWNRNGTYLNGVGLRPLVNWEHADILEYYNKVIRGIYNYYSFADNFSSFTSLLRLMRLSCARTLALKYKLHRASKVFSKFGKNLKDPTTNKTLYSPMSLKKKVSH